MTHNLSQEDEMRDLCVEYIKRMNHNEYKIREHQSFIRKTLSSKFQNAFADIPYVTKKLLTYCNSININSKTETEDQIVQVKDGWEGSVMEMLSTVLKNVNRLPDKLPTPRLLSEKDNENYRNLVPTDCVKNNQFHDHHVK